MSNSTVWSLVRLPVGPKPAPFTQPICAGPPQVGFDFDPLESAWNQRLAELRRFKEANGGKVDVPQSDLEWPGLGQWSAQQVRPPPPARRLIEPGRHCTSTVTNPEGISTTTDSDQPTAMSDAGTSLAVVACRARVRVGCAAPRLETGSFLPAVQ